MNGKTNISGINLCSAEADKHTYGCKLFNISFWGKRLLRVGILGIYIDLFWGGWKVLYARYRNGAVLFFPGGSVRWPMPTKEARDE